MPNSAAPVTTGQRQPSQGQIRKPGRNQKIRLAFAVTADLLAANGAFMPASPTAWYSSIDSVLLTGPLNVLFARDIGCACLVASVGVMERQEKQGQI